MRLDRDCLIHKLLRTDVVEMNARDAHSNTPLHYAVRKGNEAVNTALLHHSADVAIENSRKRTLRDLAERRKSRKHIAKMLMSRLVNGPDSDILIV